MGRLIMSRLMKMYAVCKSLLSSAVNESLTRESDPSALYIELVTNYQDNENAHAQLF